LNHNNVYEKKINQEKIILGAKNQFLTKLSKKETEKKIKKKKQQTIE